MFDYDLEYQRLKAAGLPGWSGAFHEQGLRNLAVVLGRLEKERALPKPPARMLELGCGNGMSSYLMAQKGYEAHGIDISETAIVWAREQFEIAGLVGFFRQGDVRAMPDFAEGFFDIVIDGSCLHCLIGDDRGRCLDEVFRILRPDGVFILSSMCGAPKSEDVRKQYDPDVGHLMKNGEPYRTLKPVASLEEEASSAGFIVTNRNVSSNPWWDHVTMTCVRPA